MVGGLRERRAPEDTADGGLSEIARLKKSGRKVAEDYQVEECAPVYDEVDEQTYAEVAARRRNEVRQFLSRNNPGSADERPGAPGHSAAAAYDEDVVDDDDEEMMREFELEEEMSVLDPAAAENTDRKRRMRDPNAPRQRRRKAQAPRPVAAAFFGGTDTVIPQNAPHPDNPVADQQENELQNPSVVDDLLRETAMEDQSALVDKPRRRRRTNDQKTNKNSVLDDILFGAESVKQLQEPRTLVTEPPQDLSIPQADIDAQTMPPPPSASSAHIKTNHDLPCDPKKEPSTSPVTPTAPTLPVSYVLDRDENGDVLIYWFDLYEIKVAGVEKVYLFGKIQLPNGSFASVCVQINGLERALYFLPRQYALTPGPTKTEEPVQLIPDVHAEVTKLLFQKCKVQAVKAKVVDRAHPFADQVAPNEETQYLKVMYPVEFPTISHDSVGQTFSRVFGTKTSLTERVLVKRGLVGPGWVKLKNPSIVQGRTSFARFCLSVTTPKDIELCQNQLEPPPFVVLSLNIKSVLSTKDNQTKEIVLASGIVTRNVHINSPLSQEAVNASASSNESFSIVRPLDRTSFPLGFQELCKSKAGSADSVPNEGALLNNLMARYIRIDPDVVVGHELIEGDLRTLLERLSTLRVKAWSRIGRLVQSRDMGGQLLRQGAGGGNAANVSRILAEASAGRLLCDTYANAKDLLPKEKDYSITSLSKVVLQQQPRNVTDTTNVSEAFKTSESLTKLVQESAWQARSSLLLAAHLSLIPLTKQLTSLSGNLWSRTMRGARAERIEFLLCHEFKSARPKLILPDKLTKAERMQRLGHEAKPKGEEARRKPQYAGGLVLEPKKGLYHNYVIQLDFNSLYPSIIQEFNICFTTLSLPRGKPGNTPQQHLDVPSPEIPEGVLPRVLRRLVAQRKAVKATLRSEEDPLRAKQLEIRQLAIKLTANSLYGCLGFENSRFFARPLAELITLQGRETLQKTIDLARDKFNAEVIYGDTDSMFVNTDKNNLQEVRSLGIEMKREVNRRYKTLEIEIDAVYARMLLLRKKKYAAMKLANPTDPNRLVREVKGLDLVRHDWSGISHDVSEYALEQLLARDADVDDAVNNTLRFTAETALRMRADEFGHGKYIITRGLTKSPKEYADARSLPHVQVALRLLGRGRAVRAGDYIKYIVCKSSDDADPLKESLADRAFHPDELKESAGKLVVDVEWYLAHQILPPVQRLCEPIDGADAARIAASLGLDSQKYADRSVDAKQHIGDVIVESEEEKFQNCDPLVLACGACHASEQFTGKKWCPKCSAPYEASLIMNQITIAVRKWTREYYCSPLQWEDEDGVSHETRNVRLTATSGVRRGPGQDERWLYNQLMYMAWMFDPTRNLAAEIETGDGEEKLKHRREFVFWSSIHQHCASLLERCSFRFVNLSQFLCGLRI